METTMIKRQRNMKLNVFLGNLFEEMKDSSSSSARVFSSLEGSISVKQEGNIKRYQCTILKQFAYTEA